jgi:hypothetical protein
MQKLLAWLSFVTAIGFAVVGFTAVFGGDSLGLPAKDLLLYGAIPLLATAIVLAVVLLVVSAFQS